MKDKTAASPNAGAQASHGGGQGKKCRKCRKCKATIYGGSRLIPERQ